MSTDPGSVPTIVPLNDQSGDSLLQPSDVSTAAVAVPGVALLPIPKPQTVVVKRRPWRVKPPKRSRVYKACVAVIAMRAQGITAEDISQQLGLTKDTIRTYLHRAHLNGWLNIDSFSEPEDRIDYVLKSKAVRNVNQALDERGEDGELTPFANAAAIKIMEGTGLLKTHQVVKGDSAPAVGVALKVEVILPPTPSGQSLPTVRTGSMGGTPAILGEVIERDADD